MWKKVIILFIILTAIQFCSLSFFSDKVIIFFEVVCLLLSVLLLVVYKISAIIQNKVFFDGRFRWEIILILISVFISFYGAAIYHGQSVFLSFISSRFMYFYLMYFVLFCFNIKCYELENLLLIVSILYSFVFLFASFYPSVVDVPVSQDFLRDTIRVRMPGLLLIVLAFFNHLSRYYRDRRLINLILFTFFMIIIIRSGTRMVIFPSLGLGIIFMVTKIKMRKTSFIAFITLLFSLFIFYPIISSAFNLASNEIFDPKTGGTLAIRVNDIKFFMSQLFPSLGSYITGNGFASYHDTYGNFIFFLTQKFNYYQADIGILGDYTKFGLVYLIGVIALLIKVFLTKFDNESIYLKYFFTFVVISTITIPNFGYSDGIIVICCGLYLVEKYSYKHLN